MPKIILIMGNLDIWVFKTGRISPPSATIVNKSQQLSAAASIWTQCTQTAPRKAVDLYHCPL